jgi:hypothetical protein
MTNINLIHIIKNSRKTSTGFKTITIVRMNRVTLTKEVIKKTLITCDTVRHAKASNTNASNIVRKQASFISNIKNYHNTLKISFFLG